MSRILKKIEKEIKQAVRVGENFGVDLGITTFLNKFLYRDFRLFKKYKEEYYNSIRKYLYDKYFHQVVYKAEPRQKLDENYPIWVMWWQGEQHMPEVVSACIQNIRKFSGAHPVHVISEDNYAQYVFLPEYIYELVRKGVISLTHLSDLIRFSLLYEWGGCWMDATLYIMRAFPDDISTYPLYTIKHGQDSPLCNGLWTSFFWVGEKHNGFFKWVLDFFLIYWKAENAQIDYFLVDDVIMLGYEYVADIRKQLNAIPVNNTRVFMQDDILGRKEKKNLNTDTYLYKLSWKKKYKKSDENSI